MRMAVPSILEAGRITAGPLASNQSYGFYGAFVVQAPFGAELRIVCGGADADDPLAQGWEHVSVSTRHRIPNWNEMCWVKNLFWDEEETAIQFHPPRSKHINFHPYTLHLWRHKTLAFPMPPAWQV